MRFVLIPAGTFSMGSVSSDKDAEGYEAPREMTIDTPFYLAQFEVTNRQFRLFQPDHHSAEYDELSTEEDQQPVVSLEAEDGASFSAWMTKQDGSRHYRLPTEAEWEHACRAGARTKYWWGSDDRRLGEFANVQDLTFHRKYLANLPGARSYPVEDGQLISAPIGSYTPNPWGLYDMLGNVWELCSPVVDSRGDQGAAGSAGASAARLVARGGSWADGPPWVRPDHRMKFTPAPNNIGLRIVADAHRPSPP